MPSPQADKGLGDDFGLPQIDDLESFFTDANGDFHYEEEKAIMDVNDGASYNHSSHQAQTPKQTHDADLVGGGMFQTLSSTNLSIPPASHSNPETPKEQFEFSLGDVAPSMTRIFSDQSGLASLNAKQSNHPDNLHSATILNQRHTQHLTSTPMRRSESHGRAQEARTSGSSTDGGLPTQVTTYNQPQAGLDHGLQFGFGARHSYLRTPVRPSGLRNSVTTQTTDPHPSVSEILKPNLQPMQAISSLAAAHEHTQSYRNRRHTDAQLYPPNLWANTYPFMDQNPVYGGLIGNNANYTNAGQNYSPYQAQSAYLTQGTHGRLIHPKIDSHQQISGMLMQQSPSLGAYLGPYQQSAFGQHMRTTMKREESASGSRPQRDSYQSIEDSGMAKSGQVQDSDEASLATFTSEQDEMYLNKILAAMYDTSRAQDNAGMISTWKTQMNDKEAVEGIARELLEVCKKRDALGRPFRKGLKPSHRFESFEDHFEALIEALTTQKTMCKHLLRQPYIEEIVDDPLGSIARITNNRKVNKGKKLAIEKGREALGQEGKGRRFTKRSPRDETEDDEQDAENESFDEGKYDTPLKRTSQSLYNYGSPDDSHDPSYREGSAPKRVKRASRSKYQLNENNEMIDTSESPAIYQPINRNDILGNSGRPNDERRPQQSSNYVMPHLRQGFEPPELLDVPHHPASDPRFPQAEYAGNAHGRYTPGLASRPRRNARR